MPIAFKDFTEVLRRLPADASPEVIDKAVQAHEAGTPLDTLWKTVNRPIAGSADALVPQLRHEHGADEGTLRKTAEDLGASFTSPVSLALGGLAKGASVASAAGKFGISNAARVAEAGLQLPWAAEGVKNLVEGETPGQRIGGAVEAGLAAHGIKNAASHAFDPKAVVDRYAVEAGLTPQPREPHSVALGMKKADEYAAMPHEPDNPAVAKSYSALRDEIKKQYLFLRDRAGLKMEPSSANYPDSAAMIADVKQNNHLNFFPTTEAYGAGEQGTNHPLLAIDPDTKMSYNDMFRAVHDYIGHASEGNSFGPKGEHAAFGAHKDTLTPEAHGALASETQGQNSQVNYGAHLRNAEGRVPIKGEPGFVPPQERPFAEQKAGLLPEYLSPAAEEGRAASTPLPKTDQGPHSLGPAGADLVQLQHRSNVGGLTELDPAQYGSGQAGAEAKRKAAYPSQFLDRTYYTRAGGFVEPRFRNAPHVYDASVPGAKLYDFGTDPAGIVAKAHAASGGDTALGHTLAEQMTQAAGYDGYHNSASGPMKDTVALFGKQPVTAAVNAAGSKGATTALSVAAPAGALSIDDSDPNDPDYEVKHALKIGLIGLSAIGLGATVRSQISSPIILANTLATGQRALGKTPKQIATFLRKNVPDVKDNTVLSAIKFAEQKFAKIMEATGGKFNDVRHLRGLAKLGADGKDWYAEGPMLRDLLKETGYIQGPEEQRVWEGLLGAMGSQNPPKGNYRDARALFDAYKTGELGIRDDGTLALPATWHPKTPGLNNVERILREQELSGRKINAYGGSLRGDDSAGLVADRWDARARGFADTSRPGLGDIDNATYEASHQFTEHRVRPKDWTTTQTQAAMWKGARTRHAEDAVKAGGAWKKPQQGYGMLQQHHLYEAENALVDQGLVERTYTKAPTASNPHAIEETLDLTPEGKQAIGVPLKKFSQTLAKTGAALLDPSASNVVNAFPERTLRIPKGVPIQSNMLQSFYFDNVDLLKHKNVTLSIVKNPRTGERQLAVVAALETPQQAQALETALASPGAGSSGPTSASGNRAAGQNTAPGPHLYDRLRLLDGLSPSHTSKPVYTDQVPF